MNTSRTTSALAALLAVMALAGCGRSDEAAAPADGATAPGGSVTTPPPAGPGPGTGGGTGTGTGGGMDTAPPPAAPGASAPPAGSSGLAPQDSNRAAS
jgi:hypothetical protein